MRTLNAADLENQPARWLIFLCEVAVIGVAIWWGVVSRPASDFDGMLSGWCGGVLVLSAIGVCACVGGSFYALGPELLHAIELVKHVIGASLLVASLGAVVFLAIGINMAGEHRSPEQVTGTLDRYEFGGRGAQHKEYGLLRLANGVEFRLPEPQLTRSKIYLGTQVPVLLYRGNLFDWGRLDDTSR